jgi:outer membrane lipoprotein-sorting protein
VDFLGSAVLRTKTLIHLLATICIFVPGAVRAAPAPSAARPEPGLDLLCRRLDGAWSTVRTYRADLSWPNPEPGGEPGRGLFAYQRPDRWLLEFRTPRPEKYMIQGDQGWVMIGRLNQAIHYRLRPEERVQVGLLILGQPTSELARFYVLGTRPTAEDRRAMGAGAPALTLEPRRPGSLAVRRAVLFLDPATYLPRKVRIQLEAGDDLRITLSRPVKNGRLDPSVWAVSFPESTHVIEQ